jgi:predicted glutamine amidotransferase
VCRLLGMSGGERPVQATFWLLDAPDSLTAQSHGNADGTGLGTFDRERRPVVDKAPISAFEDAGFARAARTIESTTFVAHVRFASTGAHTYANTHPFQQHDRLFAHNGVVGDLPRLEAELGADRTLVVGDTDSERVFALITREIEARGGDVGAGISAAARWAAAHLPLYALNLVLTTASELWALRYPATHSLYVLERAAGGHRGDQPLAHESSLGSRIHSEQAGDRRIAVVASERMDGDPDWRELAPGELLHVSPTLEVSRQVVLPEAPAHPLTLGELDEHTRSSQSRTA